MENYSRVDELMMKFTDILTNASTNVPSELYDRVYAHAGRERRKFEEQFPQFLVNKGTRDVRDVMYPIAESLMELDKAESEALANYREMGRNGQLPPEKMPAHFENFSLEDLIALNLYRSRQKWDAELLRRLERVEGESSELQMEVEEQERLLAAEKVELARQIESFGLSVDELRL